MSEVALWERLRESLTARRPRLLGLTGGVAAGKSTLAAQLKERLAPQTVEIVATDGFLLPTAVLKERGILERKGFPESYDADKLVRFLEAIRAGRSALAPLYSHVLYDPLPDEHGRRIEGAGLVIVEGVNALQGGLLPFYDLALYLDASEDDQRRWYEERLRRIRDEVRDQPETQLHFLARLSEEEFAARIARVWEQTNLKNLHEHIYPTKARADLILVKGSDHRLVHLEEAQPARGFTCRTGGV